MTADEHVSRDAGTGEFVSDKYAAEHPDTTGTGKLNGLQEGCAESEAIHATCPTCRRTRTIFFDHIAGQATATCPVCEQTTVEAPDA